MASLLKCFRCGSSGEKYETKSSVRREVTMDSVVKRVIMDSAKISISEARLKVIKAEVARAQGLDLCFLLDATSSMESCMDMVKTEVSEMVDGIKAANGECDLRLSVVLYRDYDYDINENEGCDFTIDFHGSESTFVKSLLSARTRKISHPDLAEDVFTGLQQVVNLDWQAASRLLVHICDAPCHGRQFHDLPERDSEGRLSDKYPKGDKYGRNIVDLLQQLHGQCKITQYFFCHITNSTTKMIHEFKKVIEETDNHWIKDVHFENIDTIAQAVISISCSTIEKTISTSRSGLNTRSHGSGGFIPETIVKTMPDWKDIRELEGRIYKHKWYSSLEELLTRIKNKQSIEIEEMDILALKIAPHPFSDQGALRWPYHALVPQLQSKCMVVKRFKMPREGSVQSIHSKKQYLSQMEIQTVAARMAHEFNDRTQSFKNEKLKRVEFTTVFTLHSDFKSYNMEKYLQGTWIKYSNNAGYVNTEEYAATLHAFTHWTYERSEGELMVTDLQGVSQPTSDNESYMFWLCDPAIHCKDLERFTNTNFGKNGFKLFFRSHKCDALCSLLNLKPYRGKLYLDNDAALSTIIEE